MGEGLIAACAARMVPARFEVMRTETETLKPLHLGLTGGMGCGKSTAARLFEERGVARLDSDALVRTLLAEDAEVQTALRERWGDRVFEASGQIKRGAIGQIVFGEAAELAWLEGLLHPRVRQRWQGWLAERGGQTSLVEIPLLLEKSLEKHFDLVVCVECSEVVQRARLRARDLPETEISARLQRQLPLAEKVERSDVVLSNSGDVAFLKQQIVYFMDHRLAP